MGIDRSAHSLAQQAKIVYAGSNNTSYEQGDADLRELADLTVGSKQVRRICKQIGGERCDERDEAVAHFQALPLVERKKAPEGVTAPTVAVVGVDGGRLQIFVRAATSDAAADTEPNAGASDPEIDDDPDERTDNGRHWREDKIGLVMTMASPVHVGDPCPEIPANFVEPQRIVKLARELKKRAPPQAEATQSTADAEPAAAASRDEWERPEVESKRLVATRRPWEAFGPMVAARAWEWGLFGSSRQAFLGDGASNNWTMWRSYFSSFTPILDFIHALSYVFAAATAGRPFVEGWGCYVTWIEWVWQGQVEKVIDDLVVRQEELGMPAKEESAGSPRQVVSRALAYLRNNATRMNYAEYRRDGLPITSSYVESAVKQFNYRVKGTEKFWSESGAEEMLQLRADFLSDDRPLDGFWKRRQANESGQRRYRTAA